MPAELDAASLARGRRFPGSKQLLSRLGDEALVERLRRGNELAFEVIYDRHHRSLLSFCGRMLGSQQEGEDALQHTFLSAYRALVADAAKPARLKPWLYTIARNRCLSMLRARRAETRPLDDQQRSASGPRDIEQRAEVRQLLEDLKALPEPQREALVLSELGDLRHEEIAKVLDCPTSKVKSLVFQARAALIEQHAAREIPCQDAREEIAVLRRLPRSGAIRRHVKSCPPCREFAEDVRRQRRLMAVALPIAPSLGLKRSVLAAVGGAGGGGAAGGGGIVAGLAAKAGMATGGLATSGATGGGLTTLATGATLAKTTAVALAAGSLALGAGVATKQERSTPPSDERADGAASESQADPKAAGVASSSASQGPSAWKIADEKDPDSQQGRARGRSDAAHEQHAPPEGGNAEHPTPPPHASAASPQQQPNHAGAGNSAAGNASSAPSGGGGSGGPSQGGGGTSAPKPSIPVDRGSVSKPDLPSVPGSDGGGGGPTVPGVPRLP